MKQKIDLLVSFDTTGSMYPVLAQVRREVEQFVKEMFTEFTDLRLGVIAHGDYCDKDRPYTIRVMDFTRDEKRICKFVQETDKTYGGDADECYELVLNVAHNDLAWRKDAEKIFIVIGDASPHSPSYPDNKENLDWKEEAKQLYKKGIKIFAVHALASHRISSREFYKYIASETCGVYLTLDMFHEIVDLIKATCYQQGGEEKLNEFVTIIKDSGRMTRSMENNFKRLRGEEVEDTYEEYRKPFYKRGVPKSSPSEIVSIKEMGKLVPVTPGRFQIMTVDEDCAIKSFVEDNGIEFKKGRGFYELSKAETVQQYKEVIMMDRETGEMFNGSQVREELGLQPQSEKGGVNEKLHKDATKKFRVFVQSTSVNRKLIAGTTFLYEVGDLEDVGTVIEETKVETKKSAKKTKTVKAKTKDETKVAEVKAKKTNKKVVNKKETIKVDVDKLAEVAEIKKPKAKKTSATNKKVKVSDIKNDIKSIVDNKKDSEEVKFEKLTSTNSFKKVEVDKSKKKCEVVKNKETSSDKKKYTGLSEDELIKISASIEKIKDGLERCKKSKNSKNRTYLENNLKKLENEIAKIFD